MNKSNKPEVLNPIELFNTIGEELIDVFTENNIPLNKLDKYGLNIQNIKDKTKLNKAILKKILSEINKPELLNYFNEFQNNYRQHQLKSNSEFKKLRKIYNKIKHISILNSDSNDGIDLLEDLTNFLEVKDEYNIFDEIDKNIALYRISNFEPNNLNLYAWLKDFNKVNIKEYNKDALLEWIQKKEWKNNIEDINYFLSLPKKLKEFGVFLTYTPYLKNTVYGAVRWFNNIPLIQVSDRDKCLATAWYTLFHELGHVILHQNDIVFENELLPKKDIINKEKEANQFASSLLFNGDYLRKYIFKNKQVDIDFIEKTSKEFDVNPIFTAYWGKKALVRGFSYKKYTKDWTIL